MTAAANTGPASGPRPASSTPAARSRTRIFTATRTGMRSPCREQRRDLAGGELGTAAPQLLVDGIELALHARDWSG